jgi:hypothetical protein
MKAISKLNFPNTTAFLLAIIFLYAATSKIGELNTFYAQLGKSPLIPYGWNEIVGNGTLVLEIAVVILLLYNRTKYSLLLSFSLMMFFSLYIGYLLYFSYYIPCSCGGILGNLSWESHLIFNILLTILSAIAYLKQK